MSNKNQNGIGILLTAVGTIFLIFGILLATYEHVRTVTYVMNTIIETSYGYPFQPYGFILIFAGIAFIISGIYLWQIKNRKKNEKI
ncbi:MAG: hypothetical protein IAX21_09850 [Candidatus Bathyarchaeota archaeon]|nr:MAG: hypothetical protein IAX21_09850 [Candidatus Bathyarchaeota archaeon]